jgi:diaminopimelate decarboxylase
VGEGILTGGERASASNSRKASHDILSRDTAGLRCEDVSLEAIAREIGTPSYVYSAAVIRDQYHRLADAMKTLDARLHFSVKANSSIAVLGLLRELGAGLDIVSGGELFRALKAGYSGSDIVFSGVGRWRRHSAPGSCS